MTFRTKLGSYLLFLVLAIIFFTTIQGVGRVSASEIEYTTFPFENATLVTGFDNIITSGTSHTLAIKNDGTVWSWGYNLQGQLGDGTVWSWGYNLQGQLGDGTNQARSSPVQVRNLTDVTTVSANGVHSLARKSDGSVWAWGYAYNGTGGGVKVSSLPVQLNGLNNIVNVSDGSTHALALKDDGTVLSWGSNYNGELGDETTIYKTSPVQVSGLTGIVSVAAASSYSLGLKAEGTVWSWGYNYSGQLGDGSNTTRSSPVQVSELSLIRKISASFSHALALKEDGTVWAWGNNYKGKLGNGSTLNQNIPVQVNGLNEIMAVSAGLEHSLALKSDGTVWAWGSNRNGKLGDGTTSDKNSPVQVYGLSGVVAINAAEDRSFAVTQDGVVWSWGYNYVGLLGDGTTSYVPIPQKLDNMSNVSDLSAGTFHSLALKDDGSVWAWGQISNYDGSYWNCLTPIKVQNLQAISKVSAGSRHSLALQEDGSVWAWGDNYYGQLGDGSYDNRANPVKLTGLPAIHDISSAASSFSLATGVDGTVWSWGANYLGQLGNGTTTSARSPVQITALSGVTAVSAGESFGMALKSDGTVWTWGRNWYGQLGVGSYVASKVPIRVTNLSDIIAISAGPSSSLAIKNDGTLWAWGNNDNGQLGDGTLVTKNLPVQVSISDVVAVSAGYNQSYALKKDGTLWAWGYNRDGQLGIGNQQTTLFPARVPSLSGVVHVNAGRDLALAVTSDKSFWAWGYQGEGRLGNGSLDYQVTPVRSLMTSAMVSEVFLSIDAVSLNNSTTSLTVGQTEQLTATITPDNANDKSVTWSVDSSSGSNIAAVSTSGLVTAVNTGTAVIRATSNADPTKYAECYVTVTAGISNNFSATPLVQVGINPNAEDSAGIFVGLTNIRDAQGNLVPDAKLAGYQIDVNYDHNLARVLNIVDEAHLGNNFTFNNIPDTNMASVVDVVYDGTNNFEKLFFVPIALTGTSNNPTDVTIKFTSLSDTDWNDISIPDVKLTFQRGKIAVEASQKPLSIVDAVAGLQYLAKIVDAGLDQGKVNVVNMASIVLPEAGVTSIKPSVKDVMALLQYLVKLRDEHFRLVNQPPMQVNFGYHVRPGTTNGSQIEVYGLMDGDSVTLLKGSDPTQRLDGPKQAVSGPEPKVVFDNVSFGNELYLNLHVERSTPGGIQTGNRIVFENLKVSIGVIRNGQNNMKDTDVTVSGLHSGDEVKLFKWDTDEQLQSTQTVDINEDKEVFNGVDVIESGIGVQIVRPGISTSERKYYKWGDLITCRVETQWETGSTYRASLNGLVANDSVQLYSGSNLLKENTADGLYPVVLDGLDPQDTTLHYTIIRNGFISYGWDLNPPAQVMVTYLGISTKNNTDGTKQLMIMGLQQGDEVDVLKGSNNTSILPQVINVLSTSNDPLIIDNISLGSELYLIIRATQGNAVREVQLIDYQLRKVSMGLINSSANGSSTDITVNGLLAGDTVRLYKRSDGTAIGTLQVEGSYTSVMFVDVNMTNESGVKVQISRQTPASTLPIMDYSWGQLVKVRTSILVTDGQETLTVSGLLIGDTLNLYDSLGTTQIDGQQNLVPGTDGNIVISGLIPAMYQIEVIRGNIHSWAKANLPTP